MIMKTGLTRILAVLFISILSLTLLITPAQAAEASEVVLQVTVVLTGAEQDDSEDYEIVIKADDPSYPMQEGSEDGEYKFIITGENTASLPAIRFQDLGVYTYRIYQTPGTNELGIYDDSEYLITVYVTNAEDGSGLVSTVIAQKPDDAVKLDEIVFINEYEIEIPEEEVPGGEADPPGHEGGDTPKTGDDGFIWPYVLLLISAGAATIILALSMRKKKV
jgi:pilin isopeptide linkage protein